MHGMYCGMHKGTSRAEAMLSSEPVALAIIELRLSEGISQVVSHYKIPFHLIYYYYFFYKKNS